MNREKLSVLLDEKEELSKYRLFVWGTGNTASLYLQGLSRLEGKGIKIEGYCDNNSEKWNGLFDGKKVYSPEEIRNLKDVLMLIATPQPHVFKSISAQLDEMGLKWRHIDDYIFKCHKNELLNVYDLLDDDRSKEVYSELIKCRMECCYPDADLIDDDPYFPTVEFGTIDSKKVLIDCGAYVGDTIEKYIWRNEGVFDRIYAFEPDVGNLKALNYRVERLKREWNLKDDKIIVFPYGVSDEEAVYYVERYEANNGFGSKIVNCKSDKNEECRIVTIDKTIDKPFSFLKADIESYEYKMLIGAKESIIKYKPKLAICIYHNAVDFYSIPLLIHSFNKDYKMSVRHYTGLLSETVLYAYL